MGRKDVIQGNGYINVSDLRDILRALDDNVSEVSFIIFLLSTRQKGQL